MTRKPETEGDIHWIAEAHEEVGRLSMPDYRKTPKRTREAVGRIREWLEDDDCLLLVAFDESDPERAPVAMIISRLRRSPLDDQTEVFVESLYVTPSKRGRGFGRSLMEKARAWGKENGATRIKALVSSTNAEMIGLCGNLGWRDSFVILERET